jgi:hypothetical protein
MPASCSAPTASGSQTANAPWFAAHGTERYTECSPCACANDTRAAGSNWGWPSPRASVAGSIGLPHAHRLVTAEGADPSSEFCTAAAELAVIPDAPATTITAAIAPASADPTRTPDMAHPSRPRW